MTLNEHVLKNLKDAVAYFKHSPEKTVFIKLREGDEKYVEWMVTRNAAGCWYYGDSWFYWDGSIFGFKFDPKAFEAEETTPTPPLEDPN